MSNPILPRINLGAYDRPVSGVGIEFDPLGVEPSRPAITLHEAGFLAKNKHWNFPGVYSPFWRLYYNGQRGHFIHFNDRTVEDRTVELSPEHIVLIPPHSLFHCSGETPAPTFWLAFSFERKLAAGASVPVLLAPRSVEICLIRHLRRLIQADKNWEPKEEIYRNSLALLETLVGRPELDWRPPLPENFERVRLHMESALATRLSAGSLARRAGLSVAGFNRGFRRNFGTSPANFVIQTRVREAARLLLETGATIDAIAERTGFPNRAYFSRVFKQVTGTAPAAFRRQHQSQAES